MITGPSCGKDDSHDRHRGRLYGRRLFGGLTYVEKNEKGAMTPTSDGTSHIRAVIRGPKRRSLVGGEAFRFGLPGFGPKHRMPHNCSERSVHLLKAERLAMQSYQVPPWARRTDRQCIPVCTSSIMAVAIVLKAVAKFTRAITLCTRDEA